VPENFYLTIAELNDLSDQSFANTDAYRALADQLEIQGDAGIILELPPRFGRPQA